MAAPSRLDDVIALAKRRGFVFQSARSTEAPAPRGTTGPSASSSRRTSSASGGERFVRGRGDIVGLDSAVILPRKVWEASGHVRLLPTRW